METITFDIETVPQTELSNIQQHELDKKLERRFSGSSEPTTEEYESAKSLIMGTNPYFGEIVCIGLMKTTTDGKYDTIGLTGDEKDILSRFWKIVSGFRGLFISFNGLSFDVPWIIKRSMKHGLKATNQSFLNTKKFFKYPHWDVHVIMADYDRFKAASLRLTCDHLGIPSPKEEEITAENVSVAFKDGRIKEIKEYCLRDVQATYNAYLISKNYTFIK